MPAGSRCAVVVSVALCLMPGRVHAQQFAPDPGVDAVFAEYDRNDAPGCVVGVYQDGKLRYARGYGLADLEHRVPLTPGSVFDIGSTSKQFTAATIVLLAQEGKLSLDDDVRRFLPELPVYQRPITVRHLLHHTSGVRDYIGLLRLAGIRTDDVTTPEDALRVIVRQSALNFAPGDEFLYSNAGYFLLSQIVERVTGRSLRDEARDRIFVPLGMTHTEYLGSYNDVILDRAIGYAPRESGFQSDMPRWLQLGDGAVFTTVEDLLRWEQNFRSMQVGGAAMQEALHTRGVLATGDTNMYALGLIHGEHRGLKTVYHGGSWGGYQAELLRFPAQRYGVAVLCNREDANPPALALRVADVHLASAMAPLPGDGPTTPSVSAAPASPVTLHPVGFYVGSYRMVRSGNIITIKAVDGELHVSEPGDYKLRAHTPNAFEVVDAPVRLAFDGEKDAQGRARRMMVDVAGGGPEPYERITAVPLTEAELSVLAGTYRSEELAASLSVSGAETNLELHLRNQEPAPMRRVGDNDFLAAGLSLRFTHDAAGRVTGLLLTQGRARDLKFVRVE